MFTDSKHVDHDRFHLIVVRDVDFVSQDEIEHWHEKGCVITQTMRVIRVYQERKVKHED